MAEIRLLAEPRTENGSSASRRLRGTGRVPAVVYGRGLEPTPISVDARELRGALTSEAGANALFDLHVGKDRHLAIARAFQRHPIRHTVAHIDFQVVSHDEVVPAEVSLNLIGEAVSVHRAGGNVEQLVQVLHVRAKPSDIPVGFDLDVSALEVGDSIRASALTIPPGVTLDLDPEVALVVAHAPRGVGVGEGEVAAGAEEAAAPASSDD